MRRFPSLVPIIIVALLTGGLLPLAGPVPAVQAATTFVVIGTPDQY